MTDIGPESTLRGLPLTAEQDAEVRHYVKVQMQQGVHENHTLSSAPGDGGQQTVKHAPCGVIVLFVRKMAVSSEKSQKIKGLRLGGPREIPRAAKPCRRRPGSLKPPEIARKVRSPQRRRQISTSSPAYLQFFAPRPLSRMQSTRGHSGHYPARRAILCMTARDSDCGAPPLIY